MEFERAAELRDKVLVLKDMDLGLKPPSRIAARDAARSARRGRPASPAGAPGAGRRRR